MQGAKPVKTATPHVLAQGQKGGVTGSDEVRGMGSKKVIFECAPGGVSPRGLALSSGETFGCLLGLEVECVRQGRGGRPRSDQSLKLDVSASLR